ncbi:MAG: hypothetical protein MUC93_12790 [Bacteroidales bacterium]|nr:hypothetical protein [Bacteroidales bacterium]
MRNPILFIALTLSGLSDIVIKGEKSKHITIRSDNSGIKKRAIIGDEADSGTIKIF